MAAFEAWLVFLILVVNVVGELQRKRTLAASRGFLAAARLSCNLWDYLCRNTSSRSRVHLTYSRYRPESKANVETEVGSRISCVSNKN